MVCALVCALEMVFTTNNYRELRLSALDWDQPQNADTDRTVQNEMLWWAADHMTHTTGPTIWARFRIPCPQQNYAVLGLIGRISISELFLHSVVPGCSHHFWMFLSKYVNLQNANCGKFVVIIFSFTALIMLVSITCFDAIMMGAWKWKGWFRLLRGHDAKRRVHVNPGRSAATYISFHQLQGICTHSPSQAMVYSEARCGHLSLHQLTRVDNVQVIVPNRVIVK